ncbi:MAG: DNA sulfur modification protein DndB [Cyanobacteriota bacterium]|nr:DNA sulfur modification protein DndB [Cyanobacteriota bacterium]
MSAFEYVLPAIRGIQADREYYVLMCPLRLIPKLFPADEEVLPPQLRAQRLLNKSRIPQLARYLLENPGNYTLSAIAATVDADVSFEALGTESEERAIGRLHVPMEARFTIADGQHRRAAIELALQEKPELGYESVAVVLFVDIGLARSQQMFTDLNRYSVHPPKSLNILYDLRDEKAEIARVLVERVTVFRGLTELERATCPKRSRNLFALSGIYNGTKALLGDGEEDLNAQIELAVKYWEAVSLQIPDWKRVLQGEVEAAEMRKDYLHSHAIALVGLGRVGSVLLSIYPKEWTKRLGGLQGVNWARSHPDWEGRVIFNGRITKSQASEGLLTAYLKRALGLPITPAEEQLERVRALAGWG